VNKGILLIALLLTACAPWAQVGGPYLSSSSHFSIVLPQKWMMLKTSEYLLISKDGPFLQYILVQERHKSKPFEHTRKVLADAMLPQEAAQVIVDELSSDRSLQVSNSFKMGPPILTVTMGSGCFLLTGMRMGSFSKLCTMASWKVSGFSPYVTLQ